jgi:SAM-dependent methyltransferase
MTDFVDERYKNKEGLRWWPEGELVRFVGKTYGQTWGNGQIDADRHALDLGCGTGRNAWLLYEAGFQVYGIDDSAEGLRRASAYLAHRYPVITPAIYLERNDILAQFQVEDDEHYDLVVDCQTIQHFSTQDHVTAYREIARVLKPGGRFWSMHFKHGDPVFVYAGAYPELRLYEEEEIQSLVDGAGLQLASLEIVSRTYGWLDPPEPHRMFWWIIEAVKR